MRVSIVGLMTLLVMGCSGSAPSPPSVGASPATPPSVAVSPSVASSASSSPVTSRLTKRPKGSGDGTPLGYLEYLPPGYGDGTPRPLLVFLHGAGEAGDGSAASLDLVDDLGVPDLIARGGWPDDRPFIALAPQYGTERADERCDAADEVASFLAFATKQYTVDPARVYLTGISCGAIAMWDYLAAHGHDVVAAAVPISGHAEWAFEEAGCELTRVPPLWVFDGAKDDTVPVVHIEDPLDRIRACEGGGSSELRLTVYPDADHDAWSRTYDLSAGHDIYAWMREHTLIPG